MKRCKFVCWKSSKNSEWYWHLKASNGRIICQSEGYKTKGGCRKGVESVIAHVRLGAYPRIEWRDQ